MLINKLVTFIVTFRKVSLFNQISKQKILAWTLLTFTHIQPILYLMLMFCTKSHVK